MKELLELLLRLEEKGLSSPILNSIKEILELEEKRKEIHLKRLLISLFLIFNPKSTIKEAKEKIEKVFDEISLKKENYLDLSLSKEEIKKIIKELKNGKPGKSSKKL